jgi:hypothetical protein
MAKEKKVEDPFEDLGRDAKIASGEIKIDPRFIDKANITELVQLCNLLHPEMRAHPGIERRHLEEAVLRKPTKKWRGPVDRYRKLIRAFFTVHWKKIKDQLDPKCGGDCYGCHDIVVLSCYLTNHKRLKQFRSERTIRED